MKPPRPFRFVCHGRPTLRIATSFGWLPGARYTNLRDIRGFDRIGLIDVDWREYDFKRHLSAVKATCPVVTIARDVERIEDLKKTLDQASELALWCRHVVLVPKDLRFAVEMDRIPERFILGYSVPTRYGGTAIPVSSFAGRSVHILGGRPDVQYLLSRVLRVFSFDGNRFTVDAAYGDYFNGKRFTPHQRGGYYECIRSSLRGINRLWDQRRRRAK